MSFISGRDLIIQYVMDDYWHLAYFFRRFGRCVSAEPADDLVDLLEPLFRKVLDAADPALVDVTLLGAFVWDSATVLHRA